MLTSTGSISVTKISQKATGGRETGNRRWRRRRVMEIAILPTRDAERHHRLLKSISPIGGAPDDDCPWNSTCA